MFRFLKNLWSYRRYITRSASAELHSEIADSYLNWLWWVIEPLCFMLIYTFVFGILFQRGQEYFATFVFLGLTVWEFFNRMLTSSVKILRENRELVSKVYVPKYVLLASKSLTYLFKMAISFGLALGLMAVQGVPFRAKILLVLPIILVLYLVTFGLSLFLIHLGVLFSDMQNLVTIGLRMVFYMSGVFYNIRRLAQHVANGQLAFWMIRANPVAFCMDEVRKAMLEARGPSWEGLLIWLAIGIVLVWLGAAIIHKNENTYAKII